MIGGDAAPDILLAALLRQRAAGRVEAIGEVVGQRPVGDPAAGVPVVLFACGSMVAAGVVLVLRYRSVEPLARNARARIS